MVDTNEAARKKGGGGAREPSKKPLDQLTKLRDFDRQMHIQKSLEAGLSREEAERHADEDLKERDRTQDDARP